MTPISIAQYPSQLHRRDAALAGKGLKTLLLAAPTSLHLNPIAVHATNLADVVCGQNDILLCIDATAMVRVDLFTWRGAVLLQHFCVQPPCLVESSCLILMF